MFLKTFSSTILHHLYKKLKTNKAKKIYIFLLSIIGFIANNLTMYFMMIKILLKNVYLSELESKYLLQFDEKYAKYIFADYLINIKYLYDINLYLIFYILQFLYSVGRNVPKILIFLLQDVSVFFQIKLQKL